MGTSPPQPDAPASPIWAVVEDHLLAREWSYRANEAIFSAQVLADHGEWSVVIYVPETLEQVIVYSIVPIDDLREMHLGNVVEYLTRANADLPVGNFEIQLDEGPRHGEIRFKTSLDADGVELAPRAVGNLVDANVYAVDRYINGFYEAAAGRPAAACIADVESPADD